MRVTWLGHSALHIEAAGRSILVDPFFTGNPTFPADWEAHLGALDWIVVTHGHDDHLGDTVRLARAYGATVVGCFEVCSFVAGQGVTSIEPMNIGGSIQSGDVRFSMVRAHHSAATIQAGVPVYLGNPAGFVIGVGGRRVYHAGDTDLFSDMGLIQRLHRPDLACLPIGDRFTMGPETAAIACNELLDVRLILPIHWGTFGLLTGTPDAFAPLVQRGRVLRPKPGQPIEI